MAPDDFDEKLTAIHRDLHTIVMAAERAGEALHAARVLTARHKRGYQAC